MHKSHFCRILHKVIVLTFYFLCLHILYRSVSANCHQHKTTWWYGSGYIVYWITIIPKPTKVSKKNILMPDLSMMLLSLCWLLGGWKKGKVLPLGVSDIQRNITYVTNYTPPACQNFSHLFGIGRKTVINQTDSVG